MSEVEKHGRLVQNLCEAETAANSFKKKTYIKLQEIMKLKQTKRAKKSLTKYHNFSVVFKTFPTFFKLFYLLKCDSGIHFLCKTLWPLQRHIYVRLALNVSHFPTKKIQDCKKWNSLKLYPNGSVDHTTSKPSLNIFISPITFIRFSV